MCNYTGNEFGAAYPDSLCIDGYLWDADSYEDGYYTSGGEYACPECNTGKMLARAVQDARDGGCGVSMMTPWCAATIFESAVAKALRENRAEAERFLASMTPFVTDDWPDRAAVYAGRAAWDNTIDVGSDVLVRKAREHQPRDEKEGQP